MDITAWKYQPEHFLAVWEGLSALREDMKKVASEKIAREHAVRFFTYHDHSMVMERSSMMSDRITMAKAESLKGVMDWQHKILPVVEVFLPTDWSAIFCVGLNHYPSCEKIMCAQLWWSKLNEPDAQGVLEAMGGVNILENSWRLQWINPHELIMPENWMAYAPDINERAEHLAHALLHQSSGDIIPQESLANHPQFTKLVDKLTKIMHRNEPELREKINQLWPQKQTIKKMGTR